MSESLVFFRPKKIKSHLFSMYGRFCSLALCSPSAHGFVGESLDPNECIEDIKVNTSAHRSGEEHRDERSCSYYPLGLQN